MERDEWLACVKKNRRDAGLKEAYDVISSPKVAFLI